MDSLTKIRCGAALLAFLVIPAVVLGVDKDKVAKDSGKPVPFISMKALNGLKDVGKAVEARDAADTSATAQIRLIEKAWARSFRSKLGDASVVGQSPAERLAGAQIQFIDSMFAATKPPTAPDSPPRSAPQADYVAAAVSSLVSMQPIMRSLHESKRSALLVVSSVACKCVLARCEKMLAVYDSTAALHPLFPMSVVDEIKMPSVTKSLGVTSIPSWVLFNARGAPASIITGFEDPEDVRSALQSWLSDNR
jgi:hypothetical protein